VNTRGHLPTKKRAEARFFVGAESPGYCALLLVIEQFRSALFRIGLLAFRRFAFSARAALAFSHAGAGAFGFADFFELGELVRLKNFQDLIFQILAATVGRHFFFDLFTKLSELVLVAALARGRQFFEELAVFRTFHHRFAPALDFIFQLFELAGLIVGEIQILGMLENKIEFRRAALPAAGTVALIAGLVAGG